MAAAIANKRKHPKTAESKIEEKFPPEISSRSNNLNARTMPNHPSHAFVKSS
jgi:hypothetical protein